MISRISQICSLFLLALIFTLGAPRARAQSPSSLGWLGGGPFTKVTAGKPVGGQNRTAAGLATTGKQNLTGPLKFSFDGYPAAQRSLLEKFVNANYNRMVSVYGAPAPEQAGRTIRVQFSSRAAVFTPQRPGSTSPNGNVISFGPISTDGLTGIAKRDAERKITYDFTRLALLAFQGARAPAFEFLEANYVEPWYYGMADAAALQIAFQAAGSPADFNPSSIGIYALSVYDYLNRPELGNAYIYSRTDISVTSRPLAISAFRLSMAQAAFLKIYVENPAFFAQFNARLYGRGAAGASIAPAELKSLAASVVPRVEGRDFNDWVRAQHALDATVTTGQKLYLVTLPIAVGAVVDGKPVLVPSATALAQAFVTNSDGSETPSTGFGSLRAFDENGVDISASSGDLNARNVLEFNNADQPGEAEAVVGISSTNASNQMLVTLKAYYGEAEAINYAPYGAAGDTTSPLSYFGGTLGGRNGTLQISESATQNVSVTRGTWAASVPYPSGPRVQTAFSFGGATVRRNTAWLSAGSQLRSAPFLLQVPSTQTTLNFATPAGQSQIRMVSLPGFPIQTDEAAALNIAPNDLKLARYRPNLSPVSTSADGALVFGIGGDRYELYPNISAPLSPGRGYWLGVGQNGYATTVQASLPPADQTYEVPLLGGWNQIGVPFNRAMAASSIKVRYGGFAPVSLALAQARGLVAPGIWRWRPEGGYVRADVGDGALAPFEGYFIFAAPARGVALVFEPNVSSAASARSARAKADGWSVNLRAVGAKTDDIAGRFGVSSAPNIAKPPAAAQVISLRFAGADALGASGAGSGLAEAYLPELGADASWTATADGALQGEKVTLKWGKFDGALSGVRLTLRDEANGQSVPMKSGGEYAFTSDGTPRRFLIAAMAGALDAKVAPSLAPTPARTADVLTATPNASGFAPDAQLSYVYLWRNGRRVLDNAGATLDLAEPGQGDRGDTISVEVTARDQDGNVASGTVSTVVGNSEPFVADGNLRAASGVTASIPLFASDADGDEVRLNRANSPKLGVADVRRVDGEWRLFYTGYQGQSGDDKVEIVAFDGQGGRSKTATVAVSVAADAPANRAPVAFNGAVDGLRGEVATAVLRATDADGDALSYRLVSGTKYGTSEIVLDPSDGLWKLRARNFHASPDQTDSAQFVAVDSAGAQSNVATITIHLRNRAPRANDVSADASSDVEIAVAVGGSDDDGDALTFKRVGGPRNGSGELRRDSDGAWKMFYRSRAGWSGVETIRYVALDAQGKPSAPATITISVAPGSASASASASAPTSAGHS